MACGWMKGQAVGTVVWKKGGEGGEEGWEGERDIAYSIRLNTRRSLLSHASGIVAGRHVPGFLCEMSRVGEDVFGGVSSEVGFE